MADWLLPQNPAQPHPHGNEGDLPFNNCAEFVDFLVREAVASFYDQPFNRDSKAKVLAVHLMDLAYGQYESISTIARMALSVS